MAITNSFREAVLNGNIKGIRIMMKDSLLVDPSFVEFDEMRRLTSNIKGLYDAHDGREFISDKQAWDDNYMDKLMVQVVGNFSHERIDHIKEVVRKLRPVAIRPQLQTSTTFSSNSTRRETYGGSTCKQPNNYQEQNKRDQSNGSYREAKIAVGAVAGAVIGGAVAAVASTTIIGGAAIGAIIGGVTVVMTTNGDK